MNKIKYIFKFIFKFIFIVLKNKRGINTLNKLR